MQAPLEKHLRDTVFEAIALPSDANALIVFDLDSSLSRMLTESYRRILPNAGEIDFHHATPGDIRERIDCLSPGDLVILIQTGSFRLNEFRFRLELFERSLRTIEHAHLGRMAEEEIPTYIDALAYDGSYYRVVGPKLKTRIDSAQTIRVRCPGTELLYKGPFETAKLNIGDYREMKNVGGQFPIGEVFTEPSDLTQVNGHIKLFAFGDASFRVVAPPESILVTIKEGRIVDAANAPASFTAVLNQIQTEEELWVRELGFGLNRALTKTRLLSDIGSYERMCGIHLSLGRKHTIYAKAGFPKRTSRFHVDVFADIEDVLIDDDVVFANGSYYV